MITMFCTAVFVVKIVRSRVAMKRGRVAMKSAINAYREENNNSKGGDKHSTDGDDGITTEVCNHYLATYLSAKILHPKVSVDRSRVLTRFCQFQLIELVSPAK